MKKIVLFMFLVAMASFSGCQHELSWDSISSGTLNKNAAGNCLPVTVAGHFIPEKTTNDSNYLTVQVNLITIGQYIVSTDIVNGYSFKATGTFNNTGNQIVRLTCTGKPLVAGNDHFNIRFQNSVCEAVVKAAADTVARAAFSLLGSPGNCMENSIKGYYIKGVGLDTSNKVMIGINVAAPGTYSIRTDTVNGYSFSVEGTFTKTGIQTVTLAGKGVPAVPGNDKFSVTAGRSNCGFANAVAPVVPVINQDYFPLTDGSFWTYDAGIIAGDTILHVIKGDTTIEKLKYARMNEITPYRSSQYLFNQNIYDYTEFGAVDKYTSSFQYGPTVSGLLPFLKEHLSLGQTWESTEFRGVATFGQVLFNKYYYKCLNNNAAITLNGQGFTNVYIIAVYPQIRSESNSYGSTGEIHYYYYAKGIGLIYLKETVRGFEQVAMQIRNWHIN